MLAFGSIVFGLLGLYACTLHDDPMYLATLMERDPALMDHTQGAVTSGMDMDQQYRFISAQDARDCTQEELSMIKMNREKYKIFGADEFSDDAAQSILNHLAKSPKFGELRAVIEYEAEKTFTSQGDTGEVKDRIIELLEHKDVRGADNAVTLQLAANHHGRNWRALSREDINSLTRDIRNSIRDDKKAADAMLQKISESIGSGRDTVFIDNEEDDLAYLLQRFDSGQIPEFIVPYGGFVEVRYQYTIEIVNALCKLYQVPEGKAPKVLRGFPHPQNPAKRRTYFDFVEGMGQIPEPERQKYIQQSLDFEKELKAIPLEDQWKHAQLRPTVEALAAQIDNQEFTAFTALTSPLALQHALRENPERTKKVAIVMSSPYHWDLGKNGLRWGHGFNGGRNIPVTNWLMENVPFFSISGGISKTRGARIVVDKSVGIEGEKLYRDSGFEHYNEVVTARSDVDFFKMLAMSGNLLTYTKFVDWDLDLLPLWKFLGISEPKRPHLEQLRDYPDFMKVEMGKFAKPPKPEGDSTAPLAATWGADRLLNFIKVWKLSGDRISRQMNPADLHPMMATKDNLQGIHGVVRLASKEAPPVKDRETGLMRPALNSIEVTHNGNHFAATDIDFSYVTNQLQRILTAFYHMKRGDRIDHLFPDGKVPPGIYASYMATLSAP